MDLAVKYGFVQAGEARYRYRSQGQSEQEFETPTFSFSAPSLGSGSQAIFLIQVKHGAEGSWSEPALEVVLAGRSDSTPLEIVEIDHGV